MSSPSSSSSSSSYDWGLPPNPSQSQPEPKAPSGKRKVIGAVAGVAVLALVVGGVSAFVKPGSTGPLGWDEETVAGYFDYDELKHCALGPEFYESAGFTDFSSEDSGDRSCAVWTIPQEGQPSVKVDIMANAHPTWENFEVDMPGLENWREQGAGENPESGMVGPGKTCGMSSSEPGLESVHLSTTAWCEAMYPLAQQLTNLARQNEFILDDPGMFEWSERPHYVEVSDHVYDAYGEDWSARLDQALSLGEPFSFDNLHYTDQRFTVNGVRRDDSVDEDDSFCVDAQYTLGEMVSPYGRSFTIPALAVRTPDGALTEVTLPRRNVSLREGESVELEYCGDLDEEVLRDADVILEAYRKDEIIASWAETFPTEEEGDAAEA